MNVLLIQQNGALDDVNTNTRSGVLEPLGLEYLASTVESQGHNAQVELVGSNEEDLRQLDGGVQYVIDKGAFTQDELLEQVRSLVEPKVNGKRNMATTME